MYNFWQIGEAINETHSGIVPTEGSTGRTELLQPKSCKRLFDMLQSRLGIPVVTSPKPKQKKYVSICMHVPMYNYTMIGNT